jgi:PAS domain S-box-containing protein
MSETERDLRQRAILGEAIESLEDVAVFLWNEDRHYVAVNESACRIVGLERDELIGLPVGDLSEERAEPQLEQVRQGVHAGDLRFTRRDGEVVELEWSTFPTRVAGLPHMLSVCRRRSDR